MPIDEMQFLDDRIRFHYQLAKPYGMPDVKEWREIPYKDIPTLPQLPLGKLSPESWYEEFVIPQAGHTIIFEHNSHYERHGQPLEQSLYGPYLKP